MKTVSFNNKENSFFKELKDEVNKYFETTGKAPTGDYRLYLKSIILLPLSVILYIFLVFVSMPVWLSLVLCVIFGVNLALIGFNIMHDACHGSYSTKKWVNEMMGYTMNYLGSNAFIWKIKHNIIHHTYTNIDGVDDDIAKVPVLRHCPSQPRKGFHRYQHIYAPFLYAISSWFWALYTDFDKYFKRRINNTPINQIPVKEHVIFWSAKLLYITFYMVIPIYVLGFMPFLVGYLTLNAAMGLTLSLVFQLAHVVDKTAFVDSNSVEGDKLNIEESWAAHQVRTTANFATKSKLVSWLVGGLNFQVEHHLFPRVSHVHYPALSPIVERVCREHGLPYHNYNTMGNAVVSHFETMKRFGVV
ncbi:MAG: fatty acid desaturase family protein [Flavobacteriales bacterium]